MTMERKWPGGDVERREGRVGVMETEGTVGYDVDRGNSGW